MKKLFTAVCLVFAFSGCAAYVQHPGSYTVLESKAYDVVNDANDAINLARPLLASGALPPRFKPVFDTLVSAYNIAYPALQAYHNALEKGLPSDKLLADLKTAEAVLNTALTNFKGTK